MHLHKSIQEGGRGTELVCFVSAGTVDNGVLHIRPPVSFLRS